MELKILSESKAQTQKLGEKLAPLFSRGDVVLLQGDLGAGKTTFTSGVAKGLGIEETVISPTFNILKCYFEGRLPLYHIDVYRLENQNVEIGLDEAIEGDGVCLVEWPIFIEQLLPEERLEITINNLGEDQRSFLFKAEGKHYEEMLSKLEGVL